MIRLILGNVGSGKTASVVKYMKENPHKKFITNITVKGKDMRHVTKLTAEMLLIKEIVKTLKNGENVYKLKLNIDFWKNLILKEKSINIVIDEAHIFFNPRKSMSKINVLLTDFLALLRRILGSIDGEQELILITQLSRRLDVICKEMANNISYCVHHYQKSCNKCLLTWTETNETSDKPKKCPRCNNHFLHRHNSIIEVLEFRNLEDFNLFFHVGKKSYYKRYYIKNIEKVFNNYNSLQFDDLLSDY